MQKLTLFAAALWVVAGAGTSGHAMPDATTMKRLETVGLYFGSVDHCRIAVDGDRVYAYLERNDALDPVSYGAFRRAAGLGYMSRQQPGGTHCQLVERIMRSEGIID